MDWGLPGSSVHGILQATILQWVAISFSRGSSRCRNRTPGLLHFRQILHWLNFKGSPISIQSHITSLSLPLCLSFCLSLLLHLPSQTPAPHTYIVNISIHYIVLAKPFGFSVTSYGKTQMNSLASPILRNPISWIPGWLHAPSLK